MARSELVAITEANLDLLHIQASLSLFWELAPEAAAAVEKAGNAYFEKEAWLSNTLYEFGPCGFSILVHGDSLADLGPLVRSTVLYCSRDLAPGAVNLPTGPVSTDAEIITSLYVSPGLKGMGMEAVLLDAAIMELTRKDASAVEAFGFKPDGVAPDEQSEAILDHSDTIGLINADHLESAGFEIIADHPVLPRLRLELPPAQGMLSAAAVENLLAGITAAAS